MQTFKSEKEAFDAKNDLKDFPAGFCPLLGSLCNPLCVCYAPASVSNNGKNGLMGKVIEEPTVWYVYKPYCRNVMFHGQEYIQVINNN